jgi:predicted Zn finger-like uncharacterized protein
MSDSFVTQCPHCQTSFRVSHAQLSMARGVVRCGACLQVFNAAQQLLNQSTETAQPRAVRRCRLPNRHPSTAAISQKQWTGEELDLDHLDLDEELAKLEEREIQPSKSFGQPRTAAKRRVPERSPRYGLRPKKNSGPPACSATPPDERAATIAHRGCVEPAAAPTGKPSVPSRRCPRHSTRWTMSPPLQCRRRSRTPLASQRLSAARRGRALSLRHAASDTRHGRTSMREMLLDLEDDPLHLDWQKRPAGWGKRLLWRPWCCWPPPPWPASTLPTTSTNWPARTSTARWFQELCPKLGCTVPSRVDIAHIKSSNLVVRSHPEFAGALVVDAIIYNRATFSQPFPLLELRFADLNGRMIASRRFKPGEYLSGELAGQTEMPPRPRSISPWTFSTQATRP